jgi:hypothetical protein
VVTTRTFVGGASVPWAITGEPESKHADARPAYRVASMRSLVFNIAVVVWVKRGNIPGVVLLTEVAQQAPFG